MHYSPILAPVVALVAWTLLVMAWMVVTRFAEFRRLGITPSSIPDGARGVDLEGKAAPIAMWKSHNYTHLMEQPTLFYAICITLALIGGGGIWINVWLAWAYVAFRILHSLIQATVNVVRFRFLAFLSASFCLYALTIRAILAFLG